MPRLQVILDPLQTDDEVVSFRRPHMTREQYDAFCRANPDLRIERRASGEVTVMPPAHSRTGHQNFRIAVQLGIWADRDGTGLGFDSSTGFDLPNGANRAPDASWVLKTRIAALSAEERRGYLPLTPDFVIELRSDTDRLSDLQKKMQEYIDNGARLGWLVDPLERRVHVYRPGVAVERLTEPESVSGDPELPGFRLDFEPVWGPEVL